MAPLDPQIAGTQSIAEFGQRTELIIVTIDLLSFPHMVVPARFDKGRGAFSGACLRSRSRISQRFANDRIEANFFIVRLAPLFKMGTLLVLPWLKKVAHDVIMHLQRCVGGCRRQFHQ